MKSIITGGLVMAAALTSASAASLDRAKTSAEVLDPGAASSVVQIDFASLYVPERIPGIVNDDVIVSWQPVGGVQPTPFQVILPAGCFVEGRNYRVRDFEGCGAMVSFGRVPVEVTDLQARIIQRDDGSLRLDLRAGVIVRDSAELLGTLGGARVDVAVGAESAGSLPRGIENVSGIDPTPF